MKKFEFNTLSEAMAFIRGLKAATEQNISFDEKNFIIKQMIGTVTIEIKDGKGKN